MGERDFHPLSANFLLSKWLKTHWQNYVEGKAQVGPAGRSRRTGGSRAPIFVADDDKIAAAYGRDRREQPVSPLLQPDPRQDDAQQAAVRVQGRTGSSRTRRSRTTSCMDELVIHGTVNRVVDQILALREEIGDFGEIVYAGMDWVDPTLARRSMQLMAEEVMPRVNAAIGKSAAA